jgi:hypothetical protein
MTPAGRRARYLAKGTREASTAHTFILRAMVCLLAPILASCGPAEHAAYHGQLYFGQGPYLMRFSLSNGSLSVVSHLGDKTLRDISAMGEGKLLIAETASINRKEISRISWYDLKTGQFGVLYSGTLARYLASAGIIVYDDGLKLFAVPQFGQGTDEIVFSHRQNQLSTMVEVSDDTLLFEIGQPGQRIIYAWNAVTGDLQSRDALTAACRLTGAVWIEPLNRLACKKRGDADGNPDYILTDLEGAIERKLALPDGKQFLALTFIPDQNALILKETWKSFIGRKERSSVWAHDIRTHGNSRLAKNQNLGNSAVYADF